MKSLHLAGRNLKESVRDPLSVGLALVMPLGLFLIFQSLQNLDPIFAPAALAAGVIVFGLAFVSFSAAMTLAQDRESDLFARFRATPLSATDFVAGYSLAYLPLAVLQIAVVLVAAVLLGDVDGNAGLVILLFGVTAVLFIGLGMVLGTVFSYRAVSGVWAAVLMLTIFGGAWFDLDVFPGVFRTVAGVLPFAHAMDGARAIMVDGAGFGDIAGDFIWVLGYAVGVALLAIVLMRRRIMQ